MGSIEWSGDASAIFAKYDKDGSGTLSKYDMEALFTELAGNHEDLQLAGFDSWFASINEDGSGTMSPEFFAKFCDGSHYCSAEVIVKPEMPDDARKTPQGPLIKRSRFGTYDDYHPPTTNW